jgi:nucleoside-diphosphate-sugar epimerase
LAWYAKPGKYLDSQENITSLQGSLKLLKVLINCGCEQFVGAGTCAEYEMIPRVLVETDKTKPESLYAAAKLSFQLTGEQIATQCGLKFAWGRIFQLYGPQEDLNRLIPSAIYSIQKKRMFLASLGEQVRDYLHVTDVASAFSTLLEKKATGIFNICSSEPTTIRSILDTISNLLEQPGLVIYGALPYRQWEPMFICGSNDKLKQLGWAPKIPLSAGLEDMSKWMENQ